MLALGLILIVLGLIALLSGVFYTDDLGDSATILGVPIGTTAIFIVGVFAGVAILWGFSITKYGTRRGIRQRREQRRYREMSEKLERVEAERQRERDRDSGDTRDLDHGDDGPLR